MKALVMGGGIAGLCAAADLCDHDVQVSILEATPILGGRASSWVDEDGDTIDNALHVFLPHYRNCLGFFARTGGEPPYWAQGIINYNASGEHGMMPMGGGLRCFAEALRSPTMSLLDQLSLGGSILSSLFLSPERLEKCDEMSILEWSRRHGVTRNAVEHLRPGAAGLTFLEPGQASARAMLYWTGSFLSRDYLANPGIGFANGGLGEVYVEAARSYVEARGGRIVLGRRVKSLLVEENTVQGVEGENGDILTADVYISALPFQELRKVLPDSALDYRYFQDIWHLQEAPSVSVQIWFDRFVTEMRTIAAQMRGTFNCFADLHTIVPRFAADARGSMVEFVLTPAFHLRALPEERIFRMTLSEFKRIFPAARRAVVTKWRVVKERQGGIAQRPGLGRYRPVQRTPYTNLLLCGDYTRTPISAGMENACASAHLAVEHILDEHLGVKASLFSKPASYDVFLRKGLQAGACAAAAALAARAVGRRIRG